MSKFVAQVAVHHGAFLARYPDAGSRRSMGARRVVEALHRDGSHMPVALEVAAAEARAAADSGAVFSARVVLTAEPLSANPMPQEGSTSATDDFAGRDEAMVAAQAAFRSDPLAVAARREGSEEIGSASRLPASFGEASGRTQVSSWGNLKSEQALASSAASSSPSAGACHNTGRVVPAGPGMQGRALAEAAPGAAALAGRQQLKPPASAASAAEEALAAAKPGSAYPADVVKRARRGHCIFFLEGSEEASHAQAQGPGGAPQQPPARPTAPHPLPLSAGGVCPFAAGRSQPAAAREAAAAAAEAAHGGGGCCIIASATGESPKRLPPHYEAMMEQRRIAERLKQQHQLQLQ